MIDECPSCNADLIGDPIPEKDRYLFGNLTHFSRKIGLYDRTTDATVMWLCPDCGHKWKRYEPNT